MELENFSSVTLGLDELLAQGDGARIQDIMLTASPLPAQCQEAEMQLPFTYMLMFLTDTCRLTRGFFRCLSIALISSREVCRSCSYHVLIECMSHMTPINIHFLCSLSFPPRVLGRTVQIYIFISAHVKPKL